MSGVAVAVSITEACTACGACLVTCPEGALIPAPGRPAVLEGRCTACLACVEVCPRDAIAVATHPVLACDPTPSWARSARQKPDGEEQRR